MSIALRKCLDLLLTRPDFRLYEASSKAFIAIYKQYAPVVEQVSIDECFLDMSGTHKIYPDPIAIATTIKDNIRNELGFTVNVGIGDCKLLAKMASDCMRLPRKCGPCGLENCIPSVIQLLRS